MPEEHAPLRERPAEVEELGRRALDGDRPKERRGERDGCLLHGATLPPKAADALDLRTMSPPSSHGRLMTFFLGWAVVLYMVAVTATVARRLGFLAWP